MTRRTGWLLGAGYLVVVLLLTLTPIAWLLNRITVRLYVIATYQLGIPGVTPEHFGFALNVLMFVPVGMLIALILRRSWVLAVILAILASVTIELVQLLPVFGRQADPVDVVSNALGALIGALLATWLLRRRPVRAGVAR